jgi:hypothetical protein
MAMTTIQITNEQLCAYTDGQRRGYVFYTGAIAGISDRAELKRDAEALDRSTDKVELNR